MTNHYLWLGSSLDLWDARGMSLAHDNIHRCIQLTSTQNNEINSQFLFLFYAKHVQIEQHLKKYIFWGKGRGGVKAKRNRFIFQIIRTVLFKKKKKV